MAQLKIFKVTALPAILEASAMYLIKTTADRFSIYLTDKDANVVHKSPDSADISTVCMALINSLLNQPGGIAGLDLDGNLIADIIANGIDGQDGNLQSNDDYVWNDLMAPFVDTSAVNSGNRPTYGSIMGNLRGLLFDRSTMQQVWVDFHIPHDIALGTKIYPHVHWCPVDNDAGTVRWGIEYYIAKGHGQQIFTNPVTIYMNETFTSNNQWRHYVTECSDAQAILSTDIEPDSVIKCRVFRDASHSLDTYNDRVHAWQADIHYQVARIGTRHKAPDFFNP